MESTIEEPTALQEIRAYVFSRAGIALALALVYSVGTIYVAFTTTDPSWMLFAALVVALVATIWFVIGFTGYRPATAEELAEIQAGHLWHVTGAVDQVLDAHGIARLDVKRCRPLSRMTDARRPWQRRRAVFVFRNHPRRAQLAIHVRRGQRAAVLRLDGSLIQRAYVGPAGAVALVDGYLGPALVETLTPTTPLSAP